MFGTIFVLVLTLSDTPMGAGKANLYIHIYYIYRRLGGVSPSLKPRRLMVTKPRRLMVAQPRRLMVAATAAHGYEATAAHGYEAKRLNV